MTKPTLIEQLVRTHPEGHEPQEGTLDTPEKCEAYRQRMEAVLLPRLREIRRARAASIAAARFRYFV